MSTAISKLIADNGLPDDYREVVERHWRPLADRIADMWCDKSPLVIGINGAQGSGKSTLCGFLEALLVEHNLRTVTLSLDDLYLTRAERLELAAHLHPLFAT
ncbi:MAG TPA: P-loop NTPase fold protein, partial [Croceibacterium sp.]